MTRRSDRRKRASGPERVAELKQKINNEEYLYGAIARIAQVLSNELLGIPQGVDSNERKWEGSV
jgi:hypothetical protein